MLTISSIHSDRGTFACDAFERDASNSSNIALHTYSLMSYSNGNYNY